MYLRGLRALTYCGATVLILLSSCSGGGGGGGGEVPVVPVDVVLAEADIGPSGGILAVTTGVDAGLSLTVPAGAVAVATRFRVLLEVSHGEVPSLFPVYRFEPASLDLTATPVTVTIPASVALFAAGTPILTMFTRSGDAVPWQALRDSTLDAPTRTMTAAVARLGEFVAWEGNLHRLFTQELRLYDPAVPVATEMLLGVEVAVANGSTMRQVGAGSLESFWNSPAADNVLILHGVFGSPLDFLGAEDLVANLGLSHSNVVFLSFPSARGIAPVANDLYDLIVANGKQGFGCTIIGHSIGALIARYMLERSATDSLRSGFKAGDVGLSNVVNQLIMLGSPNAGAVVSTLALAPVEAALPESERALLQVVSDMSEAPDSLPILMNASYVNNATRYHNIYGDIGNGTDGVVAIASVLAVPLTSPETSTVFPVAHDDLHRRATSTGIAVLIDTLLQAP